MQDFKVILKRSFLYPLASVLLILTLLLLFSACNTNNSTTPTNSSTSSTTNPPGNILKFEDFQLFFSLKDLHIPTQIYVMASKDSPLPPVIEEIFTDYQTKLEVVDYSRDFILFAFMGFQSLTGPTIEVTQIWQIDNIIYIEAFFDKGGPTYEPGWSSPRHIVKVSKDNMSRFGEITFILLDQEGEERARAVYNISQK
jgi:hypothetical protein